MHYLPSRIIWDNWLNNIIDHQELYRQLSNVEQYNKHKRTLPIRRNNNCCLMTCFQSIDRVEKGQTKHIYIVNRTINKQFATKYLCALIAIAALIPILIAVASLIYLATPSIKMKLFDNDSYSYPIDDFRSNSCIANSEYSTIRLKLIAFDEVILTKQLTISTNTTQITWINYDSRLANRDNLIRLMRAINQTCVPVSIVNTNSI
jgi:hypothetical protein